ncbi:MAG: hypothetical protein C7B44_07155 [Sulfobacillus thermosulfidooxidans]|nr:MAG: hypothetical protein C7B44_07155 [Sulfobacillus thermosulfidooxidans]
MDLIKNHMRESVILEYKEVPTDYRDGKFRTTVSRTVSGFANSAGGVVVWGVRTGQGNNKDTPTSVPGVSDPETFVQWLNSVIPNAVQPACITHTEVISRTELTPPIVVTYIPASDLPPHQAVLETNKPYYTRLDGQFKVMEHHMLEDMFGRRRRPSLSLDVVLLGNKKESTSPGPSLHLVTISTYSLVLRNKGRGPAKYTAVQLKVKPSGSRTAWRELSLYTKEYANSTIEFNTGIERLVYAGWHINLSHLEVTWYDLTRPIELTGVINAEDMTSIPIHYVLYPDGTINVL